MKWFELIIYVCAESVLISFNLLFQIYSFGKVTVINYDISLSMHMEKEVLKCYESYCWGACEYFKDFSEQDFEFGTYNIDLCYILNRMFEYNMSS